jgi:hypothetical protein
MMVRRVLAALRRRAVRTRQQAAARREVQGPAVTGAGQGQGDVEGRQSGAHQQHRRVGIEARRVEAPGVGDDPWVAAQGLGHGREGGGRQISGADDRAVDPQHAPVGEPQPQPVAGREEVDDLALETDDARPLVAAWRRLRSLAGPPGRAQRIEVALLLGGLGRHRARQQLLEVRAIFGPREEAAALDLRVAGAGPAREVLGIVGEGAHAPGRRVQHVLRLRLAVGQARPEAAPAIEQQDPQVAGPGEQDRQQRPTETRPDHGDHGARGASLHARQAKRPRVRLSRGSSPPRLIEPAQHGASSPAPARDSDGAAVL